MPYPSPADEWRPGGCAVVLAFLIVLLALGLASCVASADAGEGAVVGEARADGPIYNLSGDIGQRIVCDALNREYLLLTTDGGGVFLMPYLGEDGRQKVMPQA